MATAIWIKHLVRPAYTSMSLSQHYCSIGTWFPKFRAINLSKILSVCTVLIGFSAIMAGPVHAGDNPTAMLILDSSKSMWGQIDGQNKVIIARKALEGAFLKSAGKINLGIVTYGHRKSVGCKDIETVLTPRPINFDAFKETVGNIRPRGSTPIASSLEIAARAAGSPQVATTIVLLSDGLDNCRQDPCAMAKKLKAQSSALKVHVIAFDNQTQDKLAALQCVSTITGGQFYPATNAKELNAALKATFDEITGPEAPVQNSANGLSGWDVDETGILSGDTTPVIPGFGKTEVLPTNLPNTTVISRTPAPGNEGVATSESSLYGFSAVLSENGKTIPNGLIWRIYSVKKKRGAKPLLIETVRVAKPLFKLKPGRYLVTVTYGKAHTTRFHTARPQEKKDDVIILNAGGLRLGSVLANGKAISKDDVRFDIYSDERDQFSKRKLIMKGAQPGLIIRLNSGIYHLVSRYGDANATVDADVTVEAGKLTEAAVNHTAGKVTFKLVRNEGGEALARTKWHIRSEDGKTISKSFGAFPTHILAEGQYQIFANNNGEEFKIRFAVQAGDAKQVEIIANGGAGGDLAIPGVQSIE